MTKYLDFKEKIDYSKLKEVGQDIKKGEIAIFPTETVYGIGTNGLNENAVKRLYEVKNRNLNKPINLLVSNIEMVKMVVKDITDLEYKLMEKFFPGPFTIILKKKDIVPNILTANKNTVGIRMPDCKITTELINYAGCPIATSSANISDMQSATKVSDIVDDLYKKVDYIIDGGKSDIGIASTIVEVIDDIPYILRQGSITEDEISKIR